MKMQIPFSEVNVCESFELKIYRATFGKTSVDYFLHCTAIKIRPVHERILGEGGITSILRDMVIIKIFEERNSGPKKLMPGELSNCDNSVMVTVDRTLRSGS
jgi:hypothetical protein